MALCVARLIAGRLACVNTDVKTQKTIQNHGFVYLINREKLHQLILRQDFIQNIATEFINEA